MAIHCSMRSHKDNDMDYIAVLVLPLLMQTPRRPARDRERAHNAWRKLWKGDNLTFLLPNKLWLWKY